MQIGYHGTNAQFDKFDQGKARVANDFYGGGVAYFTDSREIANSYARTAAKAGGNFVVYEAALNIRKLFDVDDKFAGKQLLEFINDQNVEDFGKANRLIKLGGEDKYVVMSRILSGRMEFTGDQIFKGLSKGMNVTAKAREVIKKMGYNALRYNGGLNMNGVKNHNVYLMYNASDISINNIHIEIKKCTIKDL